MFLLEDTRNLASQALASLVNQASLLSQSQANQASQVLASLAEDMVATATVESN